jgi:membrane protein implicated in regulation of membrane protease activity
MTIWWAGLPIISQIMLCVAIPSTILLIIQLVLNFTGGDSDDLPDDVEITDSIFDVDEVDNMGDFDDIREADLSPESDLSIAGIFTFRGIVAFLASFSWSTLAIYSAGVFAPIALAIGFVIGVAMMVAVAKIVSMLLKLSESGTVKFSDAIGKVGEVYIPIPPARSGDGKVIVNFQGAERECSAQTLSDTAISTGSKVIVSGFSDETLIVEAVN